MRSTQLKEWRTASGLTARVIENNIEVPPGDWPALTDLSYWVNGYVGVGIDHPWFGVMYDDAVMELPEDEYGSRRIASHMDVNGGLTFSGKFEGSDLWWFGFDTNHYDDGPHTKNEQYVSEQCELLAAQLAEYQP